MGTTIVTGGAFANPVNAADTCAESETDLLPDTARLVTRTPMTAEYACGKLIVGRVPNWVGNSVTGLPVMELDRKILHEMGRQWHFRPQE